MKNKGLIILLITLLSVLVVGLTIFLINVLSGNFKNFSFFTNLSTELVVDEVYDDDFNEIDIEANASNIYIKESLTDEIKIVIYGDKDKTFVDINENKLLIESKIKSCVGICFSRKIAKIELYLPSDKLGKIEINNNYGDIEIGDFENIDVTINEDCGDISVFSANKIDIESALGDIEIGKVSDVIIKNNLGDTKLDVVTNYLDIQANCGDIEINSISLNKDSYVKNDLGNIEIGNTNEIYIDAHTSLGDVDIRNNYNKADITLKINNNCGDIEINN